MDSQHWLVLLEIGIRRTKVKCTYRMEVNALKSQVEGMEAKYSSLGFYYNDPGRGFDKRKGGLMDISLF
jgi:hypothetical protein